MALHSAAVELPRLYWLPAFGDHVGQYRNRVQVHVKVNLIQGRLVKHVRVWGRRSAWLPLVLLCALVARGVHAQVKELGQFETWRAYVSEADGKKQCFVRSEPVESKEPKGSKANRSKPAFTVAHRPAEKVRNEVSVQAGYVYKPKSKVEIAIGDKKFFLFVDGDAAWAEDDKVDTALVQALGKGSKLVVSSVSSKGTKTTDIYSLKGAPAALKKIAEACGVR